MTNRRAKRRLWNSNLSRKRRARRAQQGRGQEERRPQLESLEQRQLLALGPQLAGIQPNDGSLLTDGQVRNIAPNELVFHFSDEAAIDPTTIENAIRITRSGLDGQFSNAVASSDFNTNRAVIIDFTADNTGTSGNGIEIRVIKNDLGFGEAPRVTVLEERITLELNSTAGSQTRASQLVAAVNAHPEASSLVTASVRAGTNGSADIGSPLINYSPLVTTGANAAQVTSSLNAGSSLQVRFVSTQTGQIGNGTQLVIRERDFGGVNPPEIVLNDPQAEERIITIDVNSNPISPTTVEELIDAINAHPEAGSLVQALLVSGSEDTVIGNTVGATQLTLAGADDITITPGFIGLGETSREVVVRFSSPLPDDLYSIEIIGTGPNALRNIDGAAFGDITEDDPTRDAGADFGLNFELDLGAQILGIVPQPITRSASTNLLSQARNEIHVYYNEDDLHLTPVTTGQLSVDPTVVDPAFYQLIFTNDTVSNTDNVVYRPTSISYDPTSDRAILEFDRAIDALGSGPGTFRLRVGTDEAIPLPPALSTAAMPNASSDFGSNGDVEVEFLGNQDFASRVTIAVTKRDFGGPGTPVVTVADQHISVELNSSPTNPSTAQDLVDAINGSAEAAVLLSASILSGDALTGIGNSAAATTALTLTGLGSSFDTATDLSVLADGGQVISAAIEAQDFGLQFPGSPEEPGHRQLRPELGHNFGETVVSDAVAGITTAFYNFEDDYGFDPIGNVLKNAITETQKDRAREAFALYSEFLGIQFVETANLGMTIVSGDVRALGGDNAGAGGAIAAFGPVGSLNGLVIMDVQDLSNPGDDAYGARWFQHAMGGIGHLLGVGFTDELPDLNVTQSTLDPAGPDPENPENTIEPIFPGAQDVSNGQFLFRPDSKDIDLYRFELTEAGRFSAETFAERLQDTSMLDTVITLYREEGGERELFARNDDYFSNDSFLELDLRAGTYWVGVSASGNDDYDPAIDDSGLGGRTQGAYDLRLNFRADADRAIVDATGIEFDGDSDGVPGGVFNYWFRAQTASQTLIVDKAATGAQTGRLDSPYQTISAALAAADAGDIVRIVANGGADGLEETEEDNLPYLVGFNEIGNALPDGATLDVPRNVSVMIDANSVVKLRRARIGVGSSTALVDRSSGSLQVLGTPVIVGENGEVVRDGDGLPIPGSVYLTSLNDDLLVEPDPDQERLPAGGDWGGLVFRGDIDDADANRFSYERQGIFLNYVSNADIRYGGGVVLVDGIAQRISPIHLTDARPAVHHNAISLSADAAISASPDSFRETNFHSPAFQFTPFTSDYDRVGPDVHGNTAIGNSINGLFVRVQTGAGDNIEPMTVSGRWDDTDIPHVVAGRLVIGGTPGGHILEAETPPTQIVTLAPTAGGDLPSGVYNYRIVFVDADGNEGPASGVTATTTIDDTTGEQSILLSNLPAASDGFVTRRLYRSDNTANPNGDYRLVAEINATSPTFVDLGDAFDAFLVLSPIEGLRARQDARLSIDPGVVVKLNAGAIETTFGADLYAEGVGGSSVVFTSLFDDRYGGGGTFDTNNNSDERLAAPGDWAGIFVGPATRASIDHALVAFGGGEVNVEGTFTGFNAIEVHQSPARIARTLIEDNAAGTGGQADFDRLGRGFNRDAALFIRASQAVVVDNVFLDNLGPSISVDVHSLNHEHVVDYGRSTYGVADADVPVDSIDVARDNQGALVRLNRQMGNAVNGMQVRGGTLTTEGVWDDTDIVHVLRNESVIVSDFHTYGGLRLESSPSESLVVKLDGAEARIEATGRPLDNSNRIGGSLQIVGLPSHPVVLTSILDCTVGAGFAPDGSPVTNTIGDGAACESFETTDDISGAGAEVGATSGAFTPGRLLVQFEEGVTLAEQDEVFRSEGAELDRRFAHVGIVAINLPDGADVLAAAQEWSQMDGVVFAEPDYLISGTQLFPNDPRFPEQWGYHNTGQTGGTVDADIDAPEAWRVTTGDPNVIVAVLDTGVDYNHPDLNANIWQNPGEIAGDGLDNDQNGIVDDVFGYDALNNDGDPIDDHGHGTHVAGTVAAVGNNGVGVTGVAWNAQILPVKILDNMNAGTTVAAIAGLDYVTMMKSQFGVNIVVSNNSWGGTAFSQALLVAVDASINAGTLFVAAAGNGGADGISDDNDAVPFYPASYDLSEIVSVAATDDDDQLAGFSNFGIDSVDIAAPGVGILSTTMGGTYGLNQGTSMASPHVAGAAALLFSADPAASPQQVKNAMLTSVDPLANLEGVILTGGRLNIGAALNLDPVPRPGDWQSIRLNQYSNDRNVETTLEDEAANADAPGLNGTPDGGEFLGSLAPRERDDDDNRRLGFEIHGALGATNDIDVYSFDGVAGSEVWFDIDATSNSLDTVVELIDASGTVLARSDNSAAETANPDLLFESTLVLANSVLPLRKAGYDPTQPNLVSEFEIVDHFTTNPRDAGMRVVLPGQPGATSTYHVRVRSSSGNLSDLGAGQTKGNYQLQIRLRELDEVPGSTVRFSDIRYATNGIELLGQPAHSPLLGEVSEIETFGQNSNDPGTGTPQELGNLAQTDKGAISVAGDLFDPDDVDFYRLTIERDRLAELAPNDHFSTIFDIDYADGLARANTSLWVFDSDGRLILTSKGSNIADDRPRPLEGADTQDLTRGSVGTLDPYIGPVELPSGPTTSQDAFPSQREVYFVAVSSNAQVPEVLAQYQDPNAINPLVRLEPVNSVRRIAEDRIGGTSLQPSTGQEPVIPVLLDPVTSPVPFELSDVSLFVSQQVGLIGNTVSTLRVVDAFTGSVEATAGSFAQPIADIALRGDGNLFAYTTGPDNFIGPLNDGTIGTYIQIDTADASTTTFSDDGVATFCINRANQPPTADAAPCVMPNQGVGIIWDAITFQQTSDQQFRNGWAVGSRSFFTSSVFETQVGIPDEITSAGTEHLENVLFHFDIANGVVANVSPPSNDREDNARLLGVGTQKIDWGEIRTYTRITPTSPELGDTYTVKIGEDSISYTAVGDIAGISSPQEVVDGLVAEWRLKALTSEAFAAYELTNTGVGVGPYALAADFLAVNLVNPDYAFVQIEVEANNGGTFATEGISIDGAGPGGRVKGIDFVNGQMYAVTDRGGLYAVNPFGGGFTTQLVTDPNGNLVQQLVPSNSLGTYIATSAADLLTGDNGQPIEFSGLTAGPDEAAGGRYADMLFGITPDGDIYAFNTAGELQPIFQDSATSVSTGLFNVHGLEFSNLDRNLWTVTGSRGGLRDVDRGHGLFGAPGADGTEPFDHSRVQELGGGNSFYFGNDRATNQGGNNDRFSSDPFTDADSRNYDFPDGAHGELISRPFSLVGYSSADKPVLYFNYFLETEDTPYDPFVNPVQFTRDSFRVFASADDGEWTLVATNDQFQDFAVFDEFDIGQNDSLCTHPATEGDPCVQPLFDNTGAWRQARIPLDRFAGSDNIRLKFEFDSAGESDFGDDNVLVSEIRAVAGDQLRDGQTFSLDFNSVLEFDLGFSISAPSGAAIQDGDTFTIVSDVGEPTTFTFDSDNIFSANIVVEDGRQYRDGDTFLVSDGTNTQLFEFDSGATLFLPPAGGGFGGVVDGDTFVLNDLTFEFDSNGQSNPENTVIGTIVDQAIRIPTAPGAITDGQQLLINDGQGGTNVLFEFDSNGSTNVGARPISLTNIELQIPIAGGGAGGIDDGDTLVIADGPVEYTFEFDKDNIIQSGNRPIAIKDSSTQEDVVDQIIDVLQAANIGLDPQDLDGGTIRLGVFNQVVSVSPPLFTRTVDATSTEIADRLASDIAAAGLGLTPTNAGNGLIRLGSTTHEVDTSLAQNVFSFDLPATQDELADLVAFTVAAANAGVGIVPINLGNGEVFLGQATLLDTSSSAALSSSGAVGVSDSSAVAVVYDPTQSASEMAFAIANSVAGSPLGLPVINTANVVVMPAGSSFSPDGSSLSPEGLNPVSFNEDSSPAAVASNIEDALVSAFSSEQVTASLADGNNDSIDTSVVSGLTGGPADFVSAGVIGDNTAFGVDEALDVDLVRIELNAGDQIVVDSTSDPILLGDRIPSDFFPLDPALRIFDVNGDELAVATSNGGFVTGNGQITYRPGRPRLNFTAVSGGTYYIGVSDSANVGYYPHIAGSADIVLQVPSEGAGTDGLTDGEFFTINDGQGNSRLFEFDNNSITQPGATTISLADIVIEMPPQGVGFGGIVDGTFFVINDNVGGGDVIFEYDSDNSVGTGAIAIDFFPGVGFTADPTNETLTTSNPHGLVDDDMVRLETTNTLPAGLMLGVQYFVVNATPNTLQLSATQGGMPIDITDMGTGAHSLAGDTASTLAASTLVALQIADIGLSPNFVTAGKIRLGSTTHTADFTGSRDIITTSLLSRSQGEIAQQMRTIIRRSGLDLAPSIGFGGGVTLDTRLHSVDTTFAPNLTNVVPEGTGSYLLSIEVVNPLEVARDGDLVNISEITDISQTGLPTTFVSGRPGTTSPDRTAVPVTAGMSAEEVARAAADAIGRAVADYDEQIRGTVGAAISDGEVFSIDDGRQVVNFEFESGYSLQIPNVGADPISILDGDLFTITTESGTQSFEFDDNGVANNGNQVRLDDLAIRLPAGGMQSGMIQEGDFFSIDRGAGTTPTVFEFTTDLTVMNDVQPILVDVNATGVDVANAVAEALAMANIGLVDPSPLSVGQLTVISQGVFTITTLVDVRLGITDHRLDLSGSPNLFSRSLTLTQDEVADRIVMSVTEADLGLTPTNLNNGRIHMGGSAGDIIDVSQAVSLTVTGRPGAADPTAVVIPIFPAISTTSGQVAGLMQSAIETAIVSRGLEVTTQMQGSNRINLEGSFVSVDTSRAPSIPVNRAGDAISTYENIVNVIGHTISNPGPFGFDSSALTPQGDASFGAFNVSGPPQITQYPGILRGMDNVREGVYVDDIIIGFAERGEMVLGATVNTNFVENPELFNPEVPFEHTEIHSGPYQLEIRGAEPFARTVSDITPEIIFTQAFDTNDRLTTATSLDSPSGGDVSDGQTFTMSDGTTTVTFEFDDLFAGDGVVAGNIAILFDPEDTNVEMARRIRDVINSPEVQSRIDVQAALADGTATGTRISPAAPESSSSLINLFGNVVLNFEDVQEVTPVDITEPSDTVFRAFTSGIGVDAQSFVGNGTIGDNTFINDPGLDVDLIAVELDPGESITIDIDTNQVIVNQTTVLSFDAVLSVFNPDGILVALNNDFDGPDPFLQFTANTRGTHYVGVSGVSNFFYDPFVAGSGQFFNATRSTGDYTIRIDRGLGGVTEFGAREFEFEGDSNVIREQGQVLIHSNQITRSAEYGVLATAGVRDGDDNSPHMGPVRVTREVNANRLAPGVTIANNVISQNGVGGIHFSGAADVAGEPIGAVPAGRIVNNTLVGNNPTIGGDDGTGIDVGVNASPTLLNNIIANFDTGISVDGSSSTTVLAGTLFQSNGLNTTGIGLGSFPITLSPTDSLFVDVDSDNLYLASGSLAIDSSVDAVEDRPELVSLRSPLGIGVSPILAPSLDAFGQTRVDDPNVETPAGQGANVFKDRGALDRSDFAGPTALLLSPLDNDALGVDGDERESFLELTSQVVTEFAIQLLDGVEPDDPEDGTGADDRTVLGENITILQDGVRLEEGRDYRFSYDATNNVIRLTPLAGIWESDSIYEIDLANSVGFVVDAPKGSDLLDGGQFDITDEEGNLVTFEYESGYVLEVPQTLALQIPDAGGAAIADGETFTISDGTTTVIFEFDDDDAFVDVNQDRVPDNELIVFDRDIDSANSIANKIVAAIEFAPGIDLEPKNILNQGGRAVHLGSRAFHTLDTSTTTITQTGQAGGVDVEQTLVVDDGTKVVEFDFVANGGVSGPSTIGFAYSQTNDEIADQIVAALVAANLGLAPSHLPNTNGLVHVGGTRAHIIDASNTEVLLSGSPGVRPDFGIRIPTIAGRPDFETLITPTTIVDAETFTISRGGVSETFELDDNGDFTPGNHVIQISPAMTADEVANAIAIAVRDADLGLSPSNAGNGIVTLGGDSLYSLDVSNTTFTQVGQPGVDEAVPIFFTPGVQYTVGVNMPESIFDETDVARAIADAINSADDPDQLQNVDAEVRDERVLVDGVLAVAGPNVEFRSSVRDGAGNPLKANRTDDSTQFTIFIGTGVDYGDAPATYGTLEADNGPRHETIEGFFLGAGHDIDTDGQPSLLADGDDGDGFDDEDGVVFTQPLVGGQSADLTITASDNGLLDAWIDFNTNGEFEPNERISDSLPLQPGDNTLTVDVPGDTAGGRSYARFRFSTSGGLTPLGPADDGEVEDYVVDLQPNPWRNADLPMDVSGDTFVTSIDVLLLINNINVSGSRPLPPPSPGNTPPPFLDVNGDGSLTAVGDVLPLINFLNSVASSGEGEGELGSQAVAAAGIDEDVADLLNFTGIVDHRLPIEAETRVADRVVEVERGTVDDAVWQVGAEDATDESVESGDHADFEDLLDELAEGVARDTSSHDELFGEF